MAFFEHYCDAAVGSNMNGGSDAGSSPTYAATNGGWDSGTGVFTPASGDPSAVSPTLVGQTANVFTDGATSPVFVGRVTAVSSTTLTVSTAAKAGTAPTTSGSGVSVNVGGCWLGPNGSSGFPFSFPLTALTNASNETPRVNFKNNATYSVTAAVTTPSGGLARCTVQGYSSSPGDGGRAVIDGGTSGASYTLLTLSNCQGAFIADLEFTHNGATGSATGLSLSGSSAAVCERCVVHDVRGIGIASAAGWSLVECEAYACNQSNTANLCGISLAGSATRCIAHDNSGGNSQGFRFSNSNQAVTLTGCIADTNGSDGFFTTFAGAHGSVVLVGCEAYNNGGDGLDLAANSANIAVRVESCNFVKNGAYGIATTSVAGTNSWVGTISNCGFGAGTQANSSGTISNVRGMTETGSVTYASDVTPWADPANGDFRITLAAAKGAGRGTFTQTAASYAGTVGYPDIGAAQHLETEGGGGLLPLINNVVAG